MAAPPAPRPSEREGPGAGGPPAGGLRAAASVFRHRNFRVLWSAALVSNIGTWMQNITVPFVLYELTGSATIVGIGAFLQFFPSVFVAPIAGPIADRYSRRHVLLLTQATMGVIAVAQFAAWVGGFRSPWVIMGLVGVNAVIAGLNIPAWQAFVVDLVPRSDLFKAVILNSAQFNGARAVGPAIAGLVLARFGAGAAFLVNALSFLAVIAALVVIDVVHAARARSERSMLREFAEGVAYVRSHAGMRLCLLVITAVVALGQPLVSLMTVFAEDVLDVGEGGYGLLAGALGFGGLLAAPLVAGWGERVRRSTLVVTTVLVYGVGLVAFALSPSYGTSIGFALVVGGASLVVGTSLNTTIQLLVSDELRGRVMAIWVVGFTAASPVGALIQGWVADLIGAPATVAIAGALMVAIAAELRLTGAVRIIDVDRSAGRIEVAGPSPRAAAGTPAPPGVVAIVPTADDGDGPAASRRGRVVP